MAQAVMTEEQRQKQSIIKSLHKAADKKGVYKTSTQEFIEQSQAYENDLRASHDKLTFLGLHRVDHAYGTHTITSIEGLLLPDQEQARKDAEKEESYGKKKSKQEAAAIARGEYADYRLGQTSAAINAINMYREYQEHPEQAPAVKEIVGSEFLQKPEETDDEVSARMCDMMRSRDQLKAKIASYGSNEVHDVLVKHLNELLECTEDAINTWQRANGVDDQGNEISEKEIKEAKHHLPLALEKYRFESVHYKRKYGQELIANLKKREGWKEQENDIRESEAQISERTQGVTDIQDTDTEDMTKIQDFITSHPEAYLAHKKEVDEAFAVVTSRFRRIHEASKDARTTLNFAHVKYGLNDFRFKDISMGIQAVMDDNDAVVRVMRYQAESASAYIRFLLDGRKTDPLHAEYIRKTWGVDAEGGIDVSLDAVSHTKNMFSAARRILEDTKPRNQAAIDKIDITEDNPVSMQETLREISEVGLARKRLHDKVLGHNMAGCGFRDMVRALTPMGEKPDMEEEYLRRQANNLNVIHRGQTLDGEDKKEDTAALLGSCRELMPSYFKQVQVMSEYIENTGILARREPMDVLKNWQEVPEFYKKAQGIRDVLSMMYASPVYELLTEPEQKRLKTEYMRAAAMTNASKHLFGLQKRYITKSYAEFHETPPDEVSLNSCSFECELQEVNELLETRTVTRKFAKK